MVILIDLHVSLRREKLVYVRYQSLEYDADSQAFKPTSR
jgi:hypothetical protein